MAITSGGYNHLTEIMGDGTIDLDGDTFNIILLDSNFTFDATNTQLSDISADEIAAGNGYTAGGLTLSNVSWTRSGSKTVFSADDAVWTATGGPMAAASYAAVYDYTHANHLLIGYINLDGNFTTLENGTLTIAFDPTDGFFAIDLAA